MLKSVEFSEQNFILYPHPSKLVCGQSVVDWGRIFDGEHMLIHTSIKSCHRQQNTWATVEPSFCRGVKMRLICGYGGMNSVNLIYWHSTDLAVKFQFLCLDGLFVSGSSCSFSNVALMCHPSEHQPHFQTLLSSSCQLSNETIVFKPISKC